MRLKHALLALPLGATLLLATPTVARADGFITPFLGLHFGGDTPGDSKLSFGASLGYLGANAFGFELDFGYAPDFFEVQDDIDFDFSGTGNLTTVMLNLMLAAPIGGGERGVRPYASGGVGIIRTRLEEADQLFDISNNDFGVNIGAGIMGNFSDNVGLRGDVRFFRTIGDPEEDNEFDVAFGEFDFWRAYLGLHFHFGG